METGRCILNPHSQIGNSQLVRVLAAAGRRHYVSAMNLPRRPRRLRSSAAMRTLVRETAIELHDFVLPLFVSEKITGRAPVGTMPGVFQLSLEELVKEAVEAHAAGIASVLLFGIPAHKDELASQAYAEEGIVQRAVRALKKECPKLIVITDVCLCEFMVHGHCGIADFDGEDVHVHNDESVELLVKTAVSHASAGADIVAPSDMMDGRIGAIRTGLDEAGFTDTVIMSYAAKFASAFYGPFRDAAESTPQAGDRRGYQMDAANAREALREVELDVEEGADIVMVKPGMPYLDIVWRVKERFGLPTAVYNVSGEYAMIKAAAANGWLDERATVLEQMLAFKRAGADLIITYWARQLAEWLR
ncbi:MAG: Porphobilinogen synthase [Chthoniobacteraceae bacterium]|nr:Porphobilinogen synthase [Chthoniobacteraceae bacterium]